MPELRDPNDGRRIRTEPLTLKTLPVYRDPLGREPGDPLDALRHDRRAIAEMIGKVGPRAWWSMWQQTPRAEGGNFLSREDFLRKRQNGRNRMIEARELPVQRVVWVRFWDCAYSLKTTNKGDPDWTVGALIGIAFDEWDGFDIYLADLVRLRGTWTDVKRQIRKTATQDGISVTIGLESNGPQKAAVDDLMNDRHLSQFTIIGVPVLVDKKARADPWGDRAREGMMWLVINKLWNRLFFDEVEAFPNGTKDDIIDACSGGYMLAAFLSQSMEAEVGTTTLLKRW